MFKRNRAHSGSTGTLRPARQNCYRRGVSIAIQLKKKVEIPVTEKNRSFPFLRKPAKAKKQKRRSGGKSYQIEGDLGFRGELGGDGSTPYKWLLRCMINRLGVYRGEIEDKVMEIKPRAKQRGSRLSKKEG